MTEANQSKRGESNSDSDHATRRPSRRDWILEWLDLFESTLFQYAFRLSNGQREIAHDAVQHAFLKLCDESPEAIGTRLPGWLFRVCRNKVFDELRVQGKVKDAAIDSEDLLSEAEPRPDEAAESADMNEHLRTYLDQLPTAQRESLDLWCRGFNYREISEITGRSYDSVRVYVHRGLHQIRTQPSVQKWLTDSRATDRKLSRTPK